MRSSSWESRACPLHSGGRVPQPGEKLVDVGIGERPPASPPPPPAPGRAARSQASSRAAIVGTPSSGSARKQVARLASRVTASAVLGGSPASRRTVTMWMAPMTWEACRASVPCARQTASSSTTSRGSCAPRSSACSAARPDAHRSKALDPGEYLSSSYYVRWLRAAEEEAVRSGRLDPPTSSDGGRCSPTILTRRRRSRATRTWSTSSAIASDRTSTATSEPRRSRFGDRVRVRRMRPEGHHRCPRYVRGVVGEVERVCGADPVPGVRDEVGARVHRALLVG